MWSGLASCFISPQDITLTFLRNYFFKLIKIHKSNDVQWPDDEVESDAVESENLEERISLAVQGESSARLEGLR